MPVPAVNLIGVSGPGAKPGTAIPAEAGGPSFTAFMATANVQAADADAATQAAGSGNPIVPDADAAVLTVPASPTAFLEASVLTIFAVSPGIAVETTGTPTTTTPATALLGSVLGTGTGSAPIVPGQTVPGLGQILNPGQSPEQGQTKSAQGGQMDAATNVRQFAGGQPGMNALLSTTNASPSAGATPPTAPAPVAPTVPADAANPTQPTPGPGQSPANPGAGAGQPSGFQTANRPPSPAASISLPGTISPRITVVATASTTAAPAQTPLSGETVLASMVATSGMPANVNANARPATRSNPPPNELSVGGVPRVQSAANPASPVIVAAPPAGDGHEAELVTAQQTAEGKNSGLATALQTASGQATAGSSAAATAADGEPSAFAEIVGRLASAQTSGDAGNDATPATPHQATATNTHPVETTPRAAHGAPALREPVEQVVVQLRTAFKNGADRINIQLKPASLGTIDVKLHIATDGRVSAVVSADRPETLDLLQRDARALDRALQDSGLRTDSNSLSFNLRGDGGHANDRSEAPLPIESEVTEDRISDTGEDIGAGQRPPSASDRALDIEV